jgi:hypothetical protein
MTVLQSHDWRRTPVSFDIRNSFSVVCPPTRCTFKFFPRDIVHLN